jgi:uncharacterized protein with FMN-binding domain
MAKMGNKLVAMCSAAVGLIYAGAYADTANQASPVSATIVTDHATGTTHNASVANTSSSALYKDGTYSGSGYDRRGTVYVAVTIAHGKISDVQIANYDMNYSESNINPVLPQEVVQRQSGNVDVVSGATSSSEDFQAAVQQALAQAQNK